jgi:hypothetical protein
MLGHAQLIRSSAGALHSDRSTRQQPAHDHQQFGRQVISSVVADGGCQF